MSVSNSRFYNNINKFPGTIRVENGARSEIESKFLVESSEFINNDALSGGAIHVYNHNIEIRN